MFDIMYGTGISHEGELVDLGVEYGVINKSGAWFSYGETRLGQGRENVKLLFAKEKNLAAEIESKIFEAVKSKGAGEEEKKPKAPSAPAAPAVKSVSRARAKIDIAVDDDE